MTQDEIRKLLGGYATNALSAEERRILYEAALEDQELFNALENEDALRELLEDPVAREQVRRALASPVESKPRKSFWSRGWLLGVAIPAAVAVIAIVLMNRANAPRLIAPPVQIASNERAPAPKPAPPPEVKSLAKDNVREKASRRVKAETRAALETPAARPQFALSAPVPARLPLNRTAIASLSINGAPSQMSEAVRQQFAAGFPANAPLYQGPLVKYSLVRSGPAGDDIRVEATSQISGYLALYEVNAAGNAKRVYPVGDVAERVLPGLKIQVPSIPIKIANAGERLRLVVVPQPINAESLRAVGGLVNGVVDQATPPLAGAPIPIVVDIPLGPN